MQLFFYPAQTHFPPRSFLFDEARYSYFGVLSIIHVLNSNDKNLPHWFVQVSTKIFSPLNSIFISVVLFHLFFRESI